MNNIYLKTVQNKVKKILKSENKSLFLTSKDNCSEMSRLVGCWILKDFPTINASILKGENIMNATNKNHDILAIEEKNKFYLIDATVWQFFKNKKNILLTTKNSIEECLQFAEQFYKGKWSISETLDKKDFQNIKKWESDIKTNICL